MLNRVIIIGYVGSEPDIRSFEWGSKMARLRVATTEKIYIRKHDQWQEHTEWHTAILWGDQANFADKYIRTGTQVYIEGSLRTRETTNKEGTTQLVTEIAGREIKIISQPKEKTSQKSTPPEFIPPAEELDDIPF